MEGGDLEMQSRDRNIHEPPKSAGGSAAAPDTPSDDSLFPLYCRECHRPVARAVSDTHEGLCAVCFETEQQRRAAEAAARQAAAEAERQRRAVPAPPERQTPRDSRDDEFEDAELGLTP
jgi:hypothetical protein